MYPMAGPLSPSTRRALWISTGLVALVLAVYYPVRQFAFVSFDDPWYVSKNVHVAGGLTWHAVAWAMTAGSEFYWHPLTWLSHMLDVQLVGMSAGGHHLTSVVLHAANTVLLFWLLRRMTGANWRSACVAAAFAVHPLHVESVAWVSERKDVLSTLFLLLAIWGYARYATQPTKARFVPVVALFGLGLMAKPMLVTLPLILLVLDFWPLGRVRLLAPPGNASRELAARPSIGRLIVEKLPLVAMAAASAVATFVVQRSAGAVAALDTLPFKFRASNAVISYVAYLGKTLWPAGLAAFYPYPPLLPEWWKVGFAGLTIVVITALAWRARRQHPYVLAGWLWYLVGLAPVIGLLQAGDQAMADRFTYVPLVGVAIIAAWGLPGLLRRWSFSRVALPVAAGAAILALAIGARAQVWHWENSAALWGHALEVTTGNHRAHAGLGSVLMEAGNLKDAGAHFEEAVRLAPSAAQYRGLLGEVYHKQGRLPEAVARYSVEVRLEPRSAEAHENLATTLARQGRPAEAVKQFNEAIRLNPEDAMSRVGLGAVLASLGQINEAIDEYTAALRLDPRSAAAHNNLGIALATENRIDQAIGEFSEAVRLDPSWELARFNLGVALFRAGRDHDALAAFNETLRINPANESARKAVEDLARQLK